MPKLKVFLNTVQNENLKYYINSFIESGAKDYPVSHISDWGIKVPLPQFENQIISSWFEMGVGHLVSLIDTNLDLNEDKNLINHLKKAYQGKQLVQMFGFDNSIFNTFLFPGIFLALDLPAPKWLKMNKFLELEGQKFSTSRNHAIWGKEIAQNVDVGVVRYYLSWINAEQKENNFTRAHFGEFIEVVIENTFKNCIHAIQESLTKKFDNIVPPTTRWSDTQELYYKKIKQLITAHLKYYDLQYFSLNKLAVNLFDLAKVIRDFHEEAILQEGKDMPLDFQKTQTALELMSLKALAFFSYPLMPAFGKALWNKLCPFDSIEQEMLSNILAFIPSKTKVQNLSASLETLRCDIQTETALS